MVAQLAVSLLQPLWISILTDWLRALLAWPELFVVVFASWWLTRTHQPGVRPWWLLSVALLSYAIARTWWTLDDRFLHPNAVPFPSLPDLFFVLQYPFFFLALILLPGAPPWGPRVKVLFDCVLLIGAASALSWYFLLAPIYLASGEAPLGKAVTLAYPLWDLALLFGLTVALIYRRCLLERAVLALLLVAVLCLVLADSWAAALLLYPRHVYQTGHPSDLFWSAFYLLVPLAALLQLLLTRHRLASSPALPTAGAQRPPLQWADFKAAARFLFPFVAALLASVLIAVRAIIAPLRPMPPLAPSLVIFGLLLLVLIRQGLLVLENTQLRRAEEQARLQQLAAHAQEEALWETNRRLETFLGIASHELKTPLTTLQLSLQWMLRRAQRGVSPASEAAGQMQSSGEVLRSDLKRTVQQVGRLSRLVNELVDIARIQSGRLELTLQPADLAAIVQTAVEEQQQAFPERSMHVHLPAEPVPVLADAERIGQVVTNYLTNALKFSADSCPVEIGVQVQGQQGQVWVRDQGPGLPPAEQERIWERFHRVPGVEVQSGSGVGLGIGLFISKTIVEQHQGQVEVQSTPGEGATFWFSLPLLVAGTCP